MGVCQEDTSGADGGMFLMSTGKGADGWKRSDRMQIVVGSGPVGRQKVGGLEQELVELPKTRDGRGGR